MAERFRAQDLQAGHALRSWLVRGFALQSAISASLASEAIVATYRSGFHSDSPLADGWSYLWNAPQGWAAGGTTGDMGTGGVDADRRDGRRSPRAIPACVAAIFIAVIWLG